jgi:hypothetical protein
LATFVARLIKGTPMSSMTGMSSFENKEGLVSVLLATLGGRSVRPSVWLTRMTKDCGELGYMRASSLVPGYSASRVLPAKGGLRPPLAGLEW